MKVDAGATAYPMREQARHRQVGTAEASCSQHYLGHVKQRSPQRFCEVGIHGELLLRGMITMDLGCSASRLEGMLFMRGMGRRAWLDAEGEEGGTRGGLVLLLRELPLLPRLPLGAPAPPRRGCVRTPEQDVRRAIGATRRCTQARGVEAFVSPVALAVAMALTLSRGGASVSSPSQ